MRVQGVTQTCFAALKSQEIEANDTFLNAYATDPILAHTSDFLVISRLVLNAVLILNLFLLASAKILFRD